MGRVVVGEIGLRRLEAPTVVLAACGLFTTRGSGVNSAECPGEPAIGDRLPVLYNHLYVQLVHPQYHRQY